MQIILLINTMACEAEFRLTSLHRSLVQFGFNFDGVEIVERKLSWLDNLCLWCYLNSFMPWQYKMPRNGITSNCPFSVFPVPLFSVSSARHLSCPERSPRRIWGSRPWSPQPSPWPSLSLRSQEESHVRRFEPRVASPVTSVSNVPALTRLKT